MNNRISLSSPVGPLTVIESRDRLVALVWEEQPAGPATALLQETRRQLLAYFAGRLTRFDLPLEVAGSDFQQAVCREMLKIPYGQTWTYGQLAKNLKSSAQPVGGACGRNRLPILIPCHRVMGAGDQMTGFSGAGGIHTKRQLLILEGWQPREPDLFAPDQ
ncbi:MAG: methylated-DNA--[protein]-cysteine S-methyltransferase [Rhodospirillales bacterium]|nr:methylated-DNA--[protein]-cysteine S-methyltransferase [Rhodospirillales bacterium]